MIIRFHIILHHIMSYHIISYHGMSQALAHRLRGWAPLSVDADSSDLAQLEADRTALEANNDNDNTYN